MTNTDIHANSDWRTSKGLYGFLSILSAIAGAFTIMCISAWVGVTNLTNVTEIEQLIEGAEGEEEYLLDRWLVRFVDGNMGDLIGKLILFGIIGFLIYIGGLIILSVMTGNFGRDEDASTIKLNKFDRIWTEFPIIMVFTCISLMAVPAFFVSRLVPAQNWFGYYMPQNPDNYVYGINNQLFLALMGAFVALVIAIGNICFVSLIKRLKAGKFLETALFGKLVRLTLKGNKILIQSIRNSDKMILKYVAILIVAVLLSSSWLGAIVIIILIIGFVPNFIRKYQLIKSGLDEVNSGNLSYEIPYEEDEFGPKTEMDKLAIEINKIAKTTEVAVQNEVKNQTLKTELISNVSHDIKTPLTSMISYLDILKKEGLDSPRAPEYLDIVIDKTNRLKTLTEDLFEAAKASSGDMPCEITDINMVSMLEQSIVEMEDIIEANNLTLVRNYTAENSMVKADGRLLFRVIENILGNISKYSLKDSRVYIDVTEDESSVYLTAKNISKAQLNISPEELMERFKRGDAARNTEGSGLGLSITNDLTSLMGGHFEIEIDGDMFKSIVPLPKA